MRTRVTRVIIAGAVLVAASLAVFRVLIPLLDSPGDEHLVVVMKSTGAHMEFWQIVRAGIEEASAELGVSPVFVGPPFEKDIDSQIEIMEEVVDSEPDGILLAASDFTKLAPPTREAGERGITVVTLDSALDSDVPVSFVATDNVAAGVMVGEEIDRLVPAPGKIAVVSHIDGVATAIDRETGVFEALSDRAPGTVLGPFYSQNDTSLGYEIVADLMSRNPDIRGIVALNENSTIGAGRAIAALGLKDRVAIVGFDSSREEIEMLERGVVKALVVQRPFNMGYLGIRTLVASLRNDHVEPFINTGAVLVRKDDMFTEENQKLLFPIVRND